MASVNDWLIIFPNLKNILTPLYIIYLFKKIYWFGYFSIFCDESTYTFLTYIKNSALGYILEVRPTSWSTTIKLKEILKVKSAAPLENMAAILDLIVRSLQKFSTLFWRLAKIVPWRKKGVSNKFHVFSANLARNLLFLALKISQHFGL